MSYTPQPGTIPHRAVAWLRENGYDADSAGASTALVCEELGIDCSAFTHSMGTAVGHGLVERQAIEGKGRVLFWRMAERAPIASVARIAPIARLVSRPAEGEFRSLMWEGQLPATGMEIRDGVAIFTPDMVQEIKRQTDWARRA